MSGYTQAVENMAYVIDKTAAETMDHLVMEHGIMSAEEASQYMTQAELAAWDEIEDAAALVCQTYEVEYDQLMNDVTACLMLNILAHDAGVH